MSTKINVRSPYYLELTEPAVATPTFSCQLANIQNLTIDQQGQISTPDLDYGQVISITSTDSDFSNGKYSTVTTVADRVLTVRVAIPSGFTNTADGFIDCDKDVQQPKYTPNDPTPSCTGGPSASGSIPAQTLDINGGNTTINLSSYFTGGTSPFVYSIYAGSDPSLLGTSISGNTLSITSNNRAGSTHIQVSKKDSGSNTCTATQSIQVTVNAPAGQNFVCGDAGFFGGGIAQDGTLTEPSTIARITATKSTSGGSSISSHTANNTGSDRSVTLFYDLTVPDGYTNAGATVECSNTYSQPASLPTFDCDNANLYGYAISRKGIINEGNATNGVIESWTPNTRFDEVGSDTPRNITFKVRVPNAASVWANANALIDCPKPVTQPKSLPSCGSNTFYITAPRQRSSDFCAGVFTAATEVVSTNSTITTGLGGSICQNNAPFDGRDFYYGVSTSRKNVGQGTGVFYIWLISPQGIVLDVIISNCPEDGGGKGDGKGDQASL